MKKVLVYSTHILWQVMYEMQLEILEKHRDQGDEVYQMVCNGNFYACDLNPHHEIEKCLSCIDKRELGTHAANVTSKKVQILRRRKEGNGLKFRHDYNDVEELREIKVDDFDIGMAVLSSLIHLTNDSNPNLDAFDDFIYNLSKSSLELYESALETFDRTKPDLVYAFNGRFAHTRAIFRAAQKKGIDCFMLERGHNKNHYEIYENHLPLSMKDRVVRVQDLWEREDFKKKERIASEYFEKKFNGKETRWKSFTKDQIKGSLPENWDKKKTNIVVFNSSENEFVALGPEWKNHIYENQNFGLLRILKDFSKDKKYHFYLRIHPNLMGTNSTQIKWIYQNLQEFDNLSIIDAESPISSYNMLMNCSKILTFGSSMGLEATYWGKPAIQAGKSMFYYLDVVYTPENHEQVVELLKEDIGPKPKINAVKVGYYLNSFGVPFQYYKAKDLLNGKYRGVDLKNAKSIRTRVFNKIRNTKHLKHIALKLSALYQKYHLKMPFS